MGARLRSWWQQIKQHRVAILVVASILAVAIAFIIVEIRLFGTGFARKTLWDWLQLLIIPIALAIGGFWFNQIQKDREQKATEQRAKTEQEIAKDNQREVALQSYIDKMSELLLYKGLRKSQPEEEVRSIARVRTLTALRRLDEDIVRKTSVLQFLHESGLINKDARIIDLRGAYLDRVCLFESDLSGADLSGPRLSKAALFGADLSGANLSGANLGEASLSKANLHGADLSRAYLREARLSGANLGGANLSGANLIKASLSAANLSEANLSGADLRGAYTFGEEDYEEEADLSGANLSGANLTGAIVTDEQLSKAKSLKGATMPDGSIYPYSFPPRYMTVSLPLPQIKLDGRDLHCF